MPRLVSVPAAAVQALHHNIDALAAVDPEAVHALSLLAHDLVEASRDPERQGSTRPARRKGGA